jgi:hypothetical protein
MNKIFTSLSSDNNLFDFESILKRIRKEMNVSDEDYVAKIRTYLMQKHPELKSAGEATQATATAMFMMAAMTFNLFLEALDALGVKLELNAVFPEAAPVQQSPIELFLARRIDCLDLPLRVINVLRHSGDVENYGELVKLDKTKVMRMIGMGPGGWAHLEQAMKDSGLYFGMYSEEDRLENLNLDPAIIKKLQNNGAMYITQIDGESVTKLKLIMPLSEVHQLDIAMAEKGYTLGV